MKKIFVALSALLLAGCVDKSIDIAQLEPTLGINCDNLTLQLGYLEAISVGQILGDELETITADPVTGDYSISFGDDGGVFEIEGSANNFVIPEYMHKVEVDYPAFRLTDARYSLDDIYTVGGVYMGMDMSLIEGKQISVPSGLTISGQQSGGSGYSFDIPVPDFVERIERVYIDHDDSLPGAPVEVILDLGSFGDVSAGGVVSVEIVVPEDYEIYGQDREPIVGNRFKVENRKFAAGEHRIAFTLYVGSIANHESADGGVIHIPSQLEYNISYDMTTRAGSTTITELPFLEIRTDMACQDAEVVLAATDILPEPLRVDNAITVDALNDLVGTLKHLKLVNSTIKLKVEGMDWWSDEAIAAGVLEDIFVELTLPANFDIYVQTAGVQYDKSQSKLHATLAQLKRGVVIGVNSIDFGQGLSVGGDGKAQADMSFTINAGIEAGTVIRLKHLQHEGGASLYAGYEQSRLLVTEVTGRVDYSHTESVVLDLTDLNIGDKLEIGSLGLSPTIEFMLSSSITMPMSCSAKFTPYCGGQAVAQRAVVVGPIEIAAAQIGAKYPDYTPATTRVRIGKGAEAEQGVQVFDCDLVSLLEGELPEKAVVEFTVASKADEDATLLLLPQFPVEYGYNLNLPLTFGSWLDWSYTDVVDGIGMVFEGAELQVGEVMDVELICEVENTTPLNLSFEIELFDVYGNKSPIEPIADSKIAIAGSKDGVTAARSSFGLKLNLSSVENIVSELSKLETMRYTVSLGSAASGVSLNSNQTIAADFKVKINGNINVEL